MFYYDCLPLSTSIANPVSNTPIKLNTTDQYKFMREFINKIKSTPNFALRLDKLANPESDRFTLKNSALIQLLEGKITIKDIKVNDIEYNIRQKQVDMKMGLDVASLAYKKLVDKIIMIAGDSDIVPVAKVARREGIIFNIDPMGNKLTDELLEHIDGIITATKEFYNYPHSKHKPRPKK